MSFFLNSEVIFDIFNGSRNIPVVIVPFIINVNDLFYYSCQVTACIQCSAQYKELVRLPIR